MKILNIFPKKDKSLDFESLFIIIASAIILVGWLGLLLMVTQLFLKLLIIIGVGLITFLVISYLKSYKSIQTPKKVDLIVFFYILAFAIFIAAFAHESFLSGRDEGEYSNWAYYLSQQGTYRNKDLDIPNDLLNAPVRPSITKPDFHFGYISWLALHGVFGGIEGIKIANFFPLVIGLFSLYFIGKRICNTKAGIFTILMLSTSFILIWYSRQTMTETFSLALVWFGILCLLKAYQKNSSGYFILTLSSLGLFLFTRAEGMWIFAMLLIILPFLYLLKNKRQLLSKKTFCIFTTILLFFLYYSVFIQPIYFETMPESVKSFIVVPIMKVASLIKGTDEAAAKEQLSYVSNNPMLFIMNVLASYNILLPISLSVPVLIKALFSKRNAKNISILLICFLITPTFIFLFKVTLFHDQPWMLRRYLFTIIPFTYLLTAVFLERFTKKFKHILLLLILGINLVISAPILTFAQFNGIVNDQIKNVADLLPDKAIILSEKDALGFRAPLRFVFGKRTIFTYPNEVSEFIRKASSRPVYILASDEGAILSFLPNGAGELVESRIVRKKVLENIGHIYDPSLFIVQHKIFQKVPRAIKDIAISLNIYKINDTYKGFVPDKIVTYPTENWFFDEAGLKLPKRTTAVFYLYFDESKTLKMQIDSQPFEMCLESKEDCVLVNTKTNNMGWFSISFDEINVARMYERVKLVIKSGDDDFLIRKMIVE